MLRSLYSSISGLRNHQVSLDVIGNNIANVNTIGFKSGRVTFKESMAQLIEGASRPPGFIGGTNPIQVGLGMAVGSIDTMTTQGNLEATGKITDLAIEGTGYFAYGSADARFYSRMGAIQFDANGTMVSPANGFAVLGKMATENGDFNGQPIGALRVPFGDEVPAKATTEVKFAANLDSDSQGLGTVVYSQRFMSKAYATPDVSLDNISLTSLYNSNGHSLGMRPGDVITISCNSGGTDYVRAVKVIDKDETRVIGSSVYSYEDLIEEINGLVGTDIPGSSASATINTDPVTGQNGSIRIWNPTGNATITNLQLTSNRPGGSSGYITRAFSFDPVIQGVNKASVSKQVRRPAVAKDLLANLYDSNGNPVGGSLGLEGTGVPYAQLKINGAVGGETIDSASMDYIAASTTLQDLLDNIRNAFGLPNHDGTPQRNLSVSMNNADTDNDNIPDGSFVIRGQPEKSFAISNISIQASDPDPTNTSTPTRFNANMSFVELQKARDTTKYSTSIVAYDESGKGHTMTTVFTRTKDPGKWLWEINMEGGETITGGSRGTITFSQDGSPSSFTAEDQAPMFSFNPMNGSNEVRVKLNVGSPGSFRGITQFRAPSTAAAKSQDGYAMGQLHQISINEYGTVSGSFTNGINKDLAQIYVAEFNNPGGLMKMNDSMYMASPNSGEAVLGMPKVSSPSSIKPGALELSNVELATEFTAMITTQRGFQANARVVTVSDSILQELVQLVR